MDRKSIFSKTPKPESEIRTTKNAINEKVNYFKNLSPRIEVRTKFTASYLGFLKAKTRLFILEEYDWIKDLEIGDWPELASVVFIVSINSSLEEGKRIFTAKNTFIFCKKNFALGLDYFELENIENSELKNGGDIHIFSLHEYESLENVLSWDHFTSRIEDKIIEIENSEFK